MANQEQLDILKQGGETWDRWREEHPIFRPDLSNANLDHAKLRGADLRGADLMGADLSNAKLNGANFREANLSWAKLNGANFRKASVGETIFVGTDLSAVKSLEMINHHSMSYVDIHTIYISGGNIPETFLHGIGARGAMIEYMQSLVGKPIDYYTCFISYSSKDQNFAERLYADLQSKGVRCWFAPEDLKIGEKFWYRIDESIRLYDKLLVVLSDLSVTSVWAENEVMAALEKEHQQQKLVLFPIKLDETVMQTTLPWAANMRRTRHIGDFTCWKSHDEYQKAFNRLLRDLKAGSQPSRK